MAITAVTDEFQMDINITRARYAELIRAEHDAECLKGYIAEKHQRYANINYDELKTLYTLYIGEEGENGTDT